VIHHLTASQDHKWEIILIMPDVAEEDREEEIDS